MKTDLGNLLGEKFMWGKVMLFETCDRVPLIVRVLGQTKAGAISEGLVELVDLFPTLAELCEVTPPSELQGRSLVPMLHDATVPGKDFVFTVVTRGESLGKAIRTQRYQYAKWHTGEELYDLEADPGEEINLADSPTHGGTLKAMRENLDSAESTAVAKKR